MAMPKDPNHKCVHGVGRWIFLLLFMLQVVHVKDHFPNLE